MNHFDFAPEHRDPQAFLSEMYSRELFDDGIHSTANMSDVEVAQSILMDLMAVSVWEMQTNQSLNFTFEELVQFVSVAEKGRIHHILSTDVIVQQYLVDNKGQLRVIKDRVLLKEIMELTGVYYFGETPDNGEDLIKVDHSKLPSSADGIQNYVQSMFKQV